MHRSRQQTTRRIQRGGDYISTILSTISTPSSLTYSTISAITAAAGLSNMADWTQLTVTQINNLIAAINVQIAFDTTQIGNLESKIAAYNREINIDPNLQKLFNDADFVYNTTLTEYIRVSTLVQTNLSTFQYDNQLLSSYSSIAAQYLSSLQAARRDYSTLLSTAGGSIPLIQSEGSTLRAYQSSFNALSSFCGQYSPLYTRYNLSTNSLYRQTIPNLQSTVAQVTLDYNSFSSLFVASPTNTTLSTNAASAKNTITTLQTQIANSQTLLSTVWYSTTAISSIMGGCDANMIALNAQIQQRISNINLYIQISTSYSAGISEYWAQYTYWSTMEAQWNSTIKIYTDTRNSLIGQRGTLQTEIGNLKTSLTSKLAQLDSSAFIFYTKKRDELVNEVLEFQNASRECNAYVGMLTAEIMLKKLDLFDNIDTLSFYIQSTVSINDMTTKAALETQRSGLISDQTALQTQVDKMNPLDIRFNALDQIYENERIYKASFIEKRSTLYAVERNVIAYPPRRDPSRTFYQQTWADMNTAINSANSQITQRQGAWSSIRITLDQVKAALLVDPLNKYSNAFDPFIAYYPYTYNQIAPQDITQTVTVISEYALLPAIDFSKPLASYTL